MLERMGVADAQQFSAGDLVELANLIAERDRLAAALEFISTADRGGELFPSGPSDEIDVDHCGRPILARYAGEWVFLSGRGPTFLEAVEAASVRRFAQR